MGALLDAVPAGGADHTEHHRDLATVAEASQPLDSDLTAIAALTTTAYGRSLLTLADQAALQTEAGGGGGGTPGVDYPTSATVTLSSADILDLHNTPVTLVAAPGAGKWLNVHNVVAYLSYGTADYVVTVGDIAIGHAGQPDDAAFYTNPQRSADHIEYGVRPVSLPASDLVNVSIVASATDAITDGDGTLTVTAWYTVEDVP